MIIEQLKNNKGNISQTARALGIIRQSLIEQMPNVDVKEQNVLDELLPWSDSLPYKCRIGKRSGEKPAS